MAGRNCSRSDSEINETAGSTGSFGISRTLIVRRKSKIQNPAVEFFIYFYDAFSAPIIFYALLLCSFLTGVVPGALGLYKFWIYTTQPQMCSLTFLQVLFYSLLLHHSEHP